MEQGLHNALKKLSKGGNTPVLMDEDACAYLAESAGGDLRKALGCLDLITAAPVEEGARHITLDTYPQVTLPHRHGYTGRDASLRHRVGLPEVHARL